MALQMQLTFPKYGFTAPSAYLKVSSMNIIEAPGGWTASFNLKVYFSAAAKNNGLAPVEETFHIYSYSTTSANQDQYNTVKQAYMYLKSLSQFSSATDV